MEARFSGPSPVLQAVNGWHLVTIWSPISVLQFLHRACKLLICNGYFKMNGSKSIEFNELLIRRSLVRAQVEEPDKSRCISMTYQRKPPFKTVAFFLSEFTM